MNTEDTFEPDSIAAFEQEYKDMTTLDVVRAMKNVQEQKDVLDEQSTSLNKRFDYLRLNLIPKRFEDEGIENLRVEGVGSVSLTGDMYVSIPAGHRDQAYEFFRDIGKEDLITQTINSSKLKAAVKAMLKSGQEIPAELVKVTPFTRASIRKK